MAPIQKSEPPNKSSIFSQITSWVKPIKETPMQDVNMAEDAQITHIKPRYHVTVTDAPKFDLQTYISNYRGRTVFRRLYLIASCSTVLQEEAARLAVAEAKKGADIDSYEDAVALLATTTGKDVKEIRDKNWLSQQEKQNGAELKRLDNELKQYKNNLIRESIRMGSEELGIHNHNTGNLPDALRAFNKMRDYCTAPLHIATTAFRTIAVNIEQKNWLGVQAQVTKIRGLQMKPEETAKTQPKICAAQGIQFMALGDFKEAANSFMSTEFDMLADSYNEVISSNDVAVYGGLCALASMSRGELQARVLDNVNFRKFLELEPHIRRAINSFCGSKYSQCLEILESYRADYLLDIYLQEVLPTIYQKIRTKSIVQYFQPFSRVTLDSMEQLFGTNNPDTSNGQPSSATSIVTPFRAELIQMIQSKALAARIDLENNVLIAYEESPREVMQQRAIDTVNEFIRDAQIKLLRLNAINAGLEVKPLPKAGGKGGSGLDIGILSDTSGSSNGGNFQGSGYSLRSARA